MHYQLQLKGGETVNLRFSVYFMNCLCKLSGHGMTTISDYLLSMSEDLEVLANILSAGREAEGFANKDYTKYGTVEGFELLERMPNVLSNAQVWIDIGQLVAQSLMPPELPAEAKVKKPAGPAAKK